MTENVSQTTRITGSLLFGDTAVYTPEERRWSGMAHRVRRFFKR